MASNTEKGENEKCTLYDVCMQECMARKLKNLENEKHTKQEVKYGEKHSKPWKMRNAHCMTSSMPKKT